VLKAAITPGDVVAIIGAGPIGLSALMTAQFYSPSQIIVIDLDDNRLKVATKFGATSVVNSGTGSVTERVMALTDGRGVDVAIEAVGLTATFGICQDIVAIGGRIANIGVHGKSATLHLESLWSKAVTITTRLVDAVTTPLLLRTVMSGRLTPQSLVTHRFSLTDTLKAYATFGNAGAEQTLKVIISA
jgi:alcohol dehydrogenase